MMNTTTSVLSKQLSLWKIQVLTFFAGWDGGQCSVTANICTVYNFRSLYSVITVTGDSVVRTDSDVGIGGDITSWYIRSLALQFSVTLRDWTVILQQYDYETGFYLLNLLGNFIRDLEITFSCHLYSKKLFFLYYTISELSSRKTSLKSFH